MENNLESLETALINAGFDSQIFESVKYAEDKDGLIASLTYSRDELTQAIEFIENFKD